ncbi:MAG: ATP-binding protein [Burkholderiaceae bacterium]
MNTEYSAASSTSSEPDVGRQTPESYWQALKWYGVSRIVVSLLLWAASHMAQSSDWLNLSNAPLFRNISLAYLFVAAVFLLLIDVLRPHLQWQLFMHVATDLLVLTALVHFSGGVRGGLGALMIASVAAGSVLASRRLAATFAAGATLLLLFETGYGLARTFGDAAALGQAGVIGAACFLTALSVNWLAFRLQTQEELAQRRGEDVRNQLAVTRRVIAELQQGVLVVSSDGRLRVMNRAAQEMLGVSPERFDATRPSRLRDVLGPEWRELYEQFSSWRVGSGAIVDEIEMSSDQAAQVSEIRRLRVRFMAALSQGQSDSVILVENLREIEQRAQQLKLASMGRLSASIAHEIRNPLGAIRHANSLMAEQLDSVPLSRLAGIVEDNTVRINRVIEDVLSISRREQSVDERVNMETFLNEFLPEFIVQSGARRSRLGLALETNEFMRFDSNQLRQVLVNLVGNALRYASNDSSAVLISWRKLPDGRLELSIADDGPGLGADAVQHAFEPFFTTDAQGTGLGLYLARELCNANKASLRYQSFRDDNRYSGAFLIEPRPEDLSS